MQEAIGLTARLKDYVQTPVMDKLRLRGRGSTNMCANNSILFAQLGQDFVGQYSHKNGVRNLGAQSTRVRRCSAKSCGRRLSDPPCSASDDSELRSDYYAIMRGARARLQSVAGDAGGREEFSIGHSRRHLHRRLARRAGATRQIKSVPAIPNSLEGPTFIDHIPNHASRRKV